MTATIEIPSALKRFTDNQEQVSVPAGTVQQALDALIAAHASLREQLFDESGNVRSFVNIYVNERDIRDEAKLETQVHSGDVIQIVPSIAGGCSALRKL